MTDVRTSSDLRHARVYVSVLGGSAQSGTPPAEPVLVDSGSEAGPRERTLEGLRSARGFLQARLAAELHLKHTPTLEFHYDDTTDRALRVDALIDEIGSS